MADSVLRFTVLAMATAAILAPLGVVVRCREAIGLLCGEVNSALVVLILLAGTAAIWAKIYLDGCRLGWWSALAEALGAPRWL